MSFTDKINADIKTAMLARDKARLEVLRDVKSKLLMEATSGNGEASDETAIKICMKLHCIHHDLFPQWLVSSIARILNSSYPQ